MSNNDDKQKRFRSSEKGRVYQRRNNTSPAGVKRRRKYTDSHRGRMSALLNTIRARAKAKGIHCSLSIDWMVENYASGCALTGRPFERGTGHGPSNYSASVDKIDPNKGYTIANCRMILFCVNAFKQTMTDTEMLAVAKDLTLR